jgi:hypothetical protein
MYDGQHAGKPDLSAASRCCRIHVAANLAAAAPVSNNSQIDIVQTLDNVIDRFLGFVVSGAVPGHDDHTQEVYER